ncbi:MAG: hypothetical protein HS131_13725 [Ignavibacteriales bacterium]|nr:hypothetical protein [Ignavibacteriales bacterium]
MDIRLMDKEWQKLNENLKDGESIEISESTIEKLMVSGELYQQYIHLNRTIQIHSTQAR